MPNGFRTNRKPKSARKSEQQSAAFFKHNVEMSDFMKRALSDMEECYQLARKGVEETAGAILPGTKRLNSYFQYQVEKLAPYMDKEGAPPNEQQIQSGTAGGEASPDRHEDGKRGPTPGDGKTG